jgi:hypothetical protein
MVVVSTIHEELSCGAATHPFRACVATSTARLLLSCARAHGAPGHLLPAGHVGGAPLDGLWTRWESAVSWRSQERACACVGGSK